MRILGFDKDEKGEANPAEWIRRIFAFQDFEFEFIKFNENGSINL